MTRFSSFVVLAEMRTGSNLLEAALNLLPGVHCHGEAFNPGLIGYPRRTALLGVTRVQRDADPMRLWQAIRAEPGLNGCRYFHDHDPRMLPEFLDDPGCAKIVLTRNPVDSYVSLQIARATGQWKLGDARHRKAAQAEFNPAGFEAHLEALQGFQMTVLHRMQTSGQVAFYIDYDDVQDVAVLNGLAAWLGVGAGLDTLPADLVPQNPGPLEAKVANFPEMEAALTRLDRFNLSRTPNFEPRRGPNVPGILGCALSDTAGLLFLPLRPAPVGAVRDWLAQIGTLEEGFSQKTLRQWKKARPDHRSFTVLRHPLLRAHLALAAVLSWDAMAETRQVLRKTYKLPLPPEGRLPGPEGWAKLLLAFLKWLKMNLNGQTSLPVSYLWASQSAAVQGFAQFSTPDLLVREDRMAEDLEYLARALGVDAPRCTAAPDGAPVDLAAIWSSDLEKAARDAYARDYIQFGFRDWTAAG